MQRIEVKQGSKEWCEEYVNSIKEMGYEIIDYVLIPFEDEWMVAVNYFEED